MAGEARPGVEPMVEARTRFLALIAAGASNSVAAWEVGIDRRTSTRWRYGRTVITRHGGLLLCPGVACEHDRRQRQVPQ